MNLEPFLEVRVSTDRFLLTCVAGAWKQWAEEKTGAREGDTRRKRLTPRVSPSGAPVLSFAHYFQAPVTQASFLFVCLVFFFIRLSVSVDARIKAYEQRKSERTKNVLPVTPIPRSFRAIFFDPLSPQS